ncbi:hypothetical protein M9458_052251 [Cirrhinus mrigala]|uniref:Tc1-like transposase DDE domain-containing protein n=1 Tax=Cirrhinus mrigala TaxID=683832 RepID=A0ABD0MR48_CIRMR
MKRVYRVPFERNSARHKDLRYEYVQRILQLDAMARPHEYLFLDEAGFNLQKRRQRGCNIIGQRAITEVPGQRGGNITLCAAMGSEGLVHWHAVLGSYNTQRLLTFLEELRDILLDRQQHHPGPAHHIYVIIWDNVRFHRTNQIREWFTTNSNQFLNVCLPPYSLFLNPIEEFFSSWRWKVYDRQPYTVCTTVHAVFSIDLYSSYETHKSKCLILCRDLRRSVTVKFLKICIGSYETKNLLTN